MSAADEYQRVLEDHCVVTMTRAGMTCGCGERMTWPAFPAHVAQALAADPGVRAAVEREALTKGGWVSHVRAEAWDEGFDAAEQDLFKHEQAGWRDDDPCIPNPYRQETTDDK